MNINECAEKAVYYKQSCNCCQAVSAALAEMLDLNIDELMMLSSGFGAGMGNMEATCGALVGAVMIAGIAAQGRGTVRMSRQISEKFKAKCGSITCKELKGFPGGKVLCPCDECVKNAVLAFGEVIGA